MQPFTMMAAPFNPAGDSGVVMVENSSGGGDVNAFRHGSHDHGDPRQRRFQPIQGCAETTGSATATRLTLEVADTLLATTTVADKGMNRRVSNSEVITGGIEASVTASVNRLWTAAAALAFRPGQHIQFGAMGEEADIAITLRTLNRRFRPQATWNSSLAEEVTPPAAEAARDYRFSCAYITNVE